MAFIPTRRFFIWSGLSAGALVVGYALTPFSNLTRAREVAGKGEAMLTAWVRSLAAAACGQPAAGKEEAANS